MANESRPSDEGAGHEGLGQAFGLLGGVVAGSTVLGLLGAGIFMPVVGAAGLGVKSMVESFDAMPAEFTASPMSQQTRVLAADGSLLATLYEENRQVVPLKEIAPIMVEAQIAIEDDRFYEHAGIDPRGIARALVATVRGDTQGASTITQQYIRQTLVYTALKSDNAEGAEAAMERGGVAGIVRKLQEMKYAIALEENLNKDQILEGYLNLVYYGAGAYGVEAASQRYFGIRASKLNLPQAAMIAGMAQRPSYTNPFERPEATLERRNAVLQRMFATGHITRKQMNDAIKAPLGLKATFPKASCPSSVDPYFCDYVSNWLLEQESFGKTREERQKLLYRGGLKIETTYQPKLANSARKIVKAAAPVAQSKNRGAAIAVVEPGTGKVLAMAQNTEYGQGSGEAGVETTVNWSVDSKYGASGGFQIGSTVKVYGVVAALEAGMTAKTVINAHAAGTRYSVRQLGGDKCGFTGASFGVRNSESKSSGPITLQEMTAKSVNTAFVELSARIGLCGQQELMKRMGLHTGVGQPYGQTHAITVILGADNASPLTLAASYATLAAGGKYCAPVPVVKVTGFDGTDYPIKTEGCTQAVEPKVAFEATRILETVMKEGGTGRALALAGGLQSAGKTGTADGSVHTWFAGYTPQLSAAAWVGRPNRQSPMPGVYGSTIAGPIWQKVMNEASAGMPYERFALNSSTRVSTARVPDVVGRSENSAKRRLQDEGFSVVVADKKVPSDSVDFGRVAQTDPAAGASVPQGTEVTVSLSRGPAN